MLDALSRRAERRGIGNLEPTQGDATALPYEDSSIDGAFLVTVLGEIPDQEAALPRASARAAPRRAGGVRETVFDPHPVTLGALKRRAEAAGLRFERTLGVPPPGFYARFSA